VTSTLTTSIREMLQTARTRKTGLHTGRKIITFKPGASQAGVAALSQSADLRVAHSTDFNNGVDFGKLGDASSLVLSHLNVAVIAEEAATGPLSTHLAAAGQTDSTILAVEPEVFVFTANDYLQAYLLSLAMATETMRQYSNLSAQGASLAWQQGQQAALSQATWGILATGAFSSRYSGAGIKIAMLDTGLDLNHPDFQNRVANQQSFIPEETTVQDGNGHGTHTTGTACGPKTPANGPRYGIACESQIFVGKVLGSDGGGTTATVLAGMNWAVANRCEIISMSVASDNVPPQVSYTQAGQAALQAGCLMIAAAGNASRRPGTIAPTGAPADSPTIFSVAAVDSNMQIAMFSSGGKVQVAGPGVDIYSSWPMPQDYKMDSGTSMATPHVAGAAALWAQSNPALRGQALGNALLQSVKMLSYAASDVGSGLVQCP
jgi:subtilisin